MGNNFSSGGFVINFVIGNNYDFSSGGNGLFNGGYSVLV